MRRGRYQAKREVAAPVNNRNPDNRKFRVARKFNAHCEKERRATPTLVLTRKLFPCNRKRLYFPTCPRKGPAISFLSAEVRSFSSSFWVMAWAGRCTLLRCPGRGLGGRAVRPSLD